MRSSPSTDRRREAAESLAVEALGFLADDDTRLERFLSLSGLGPENLRAAASAPGFFAAVLDHVAGDETLLLAYAAHGGHAPTEVVRARDVLAPPTLEMP